MTKQNLVEVVLKTAKLPTKRKAQEAVDTVFGAITKALKRREEVTITGFGTFRVVKSAGRTGVNPKTREKIQIPPTARPKFRAGKSLKEAVR